MNLHPHTHALPVTLHFGYIILEVSSDASSDMTPGKVIGAFIQASVASRFLRFFSSEERFLTMLITLGGGGGCSVIPMPSPADIVSYLVRVLVVISLIISSLATPVVSVTSRGGWKGQSLMDLSWVPFGKDRRRWNGPDYHAG
ncbi:hypothetical protein Tco_0674407 [Tanacetum coccineum]